MTLSPLPAADVTAAGELLAASRCVMFDFDGPLADLFAERKAPAVADALKDRVGSWRAPSFGSSFTDPDDPHQVLLEVASAYRSPEYGYRVAELEKVLTEQEVAAAVTARPTPHAGELVRRLADLGKTIAMTTNNAAAAAAAYLDVQGLSAFFGAHVHGRAADPGLMKPHPNCLAEALRSTGSEPADCVMIGDSPSDFAAARKLGIAFVGYARNNQKRKALAEAGARHIVGSMELVCEAPADS